MRTLTENDAEVNAETEESRPTWMDADGPTEEDARWWVGENEGGCHPDDLSPEDRLIAMAMTAMDHLLDQCGEEYEARCRYEAGYAFY